MMPVKQVMLLTGIIPAKRVEPILGDIFALKSLVKKISFAKSCLHSRATLTCCLPGAPADDDHHGG